MCDPYAVWVHYSPPGELDYSVAARARSRLTNQQIARRLSVTERTVRAHVSAILAKLGLASRTQAAVWAAQHDPGW